MDKPTQPVPFLDGEQRPISNELFSAFKDNFSLVFDYLSHGQSPVHTLNAIFMSWFTHDYKPASEGDRKRVETYLELLAFLYDLQNSLSVMEYCWDDNKKAGFSND